MIEFLAFSKIGMDFSLSRFFEKKFFFFRIRFWREKILRQNHFCLKLSGKKSSTKFSFPLSIPKVLFFPKTKHFFSPKQNEILDRSSERAKDVFPCYSRGRKSHRIEVGKPSETFWKEAIKFITDSRTTNFSPSPKKIPF